MNLKLRKIGGVFALIFFGFFAQAQSPANVIQVRIKGAVDSLRIALVIEGEGYQSPSGSHKITYTFIAEELTTREPKTWDSNQPSKEIWLPRGNWRITRDINICKPDGNRCDVVETVKSNPLAFVWRQ